MPTSEFVTPATADYLWLGVAVIVLIMGVLVTSLFTRARSLQRDMEMLDSLEQD